MAKKQIIPYEYYSQYLTEEECNYVKKHNITFNICQYTQIGITVNKEFYTNEINWDNVKRALLLHKSYYEDKKELPF